MEEVLSQIPTKKTLEKTYIWALVVELQPVVKIPPAVVELQPVAW